MSETAILIAARERGEVEDVETKRIGAALIFERLWRETGCHGVISSLLRNRGFQFSVERAVFITVLHRLFESGSDRQADRWKADYRIEGADEVGLHHLYRAMAWLGEELPEREQFGRTPFAPRCTKDLIEEQLFVRRRDLFSSLDIVFSTRHRSTSKARAERHSVSEGTARITGPT